LMCFEARDLKAKEPIQIVESSSRLPLLAGIKTFRCASAQRHSE
jgi:hypothetical protein